MSAAGEPQYRMIVGIPSYAQAHQDLFVCAMLGFREHGTYLEIGGADPVEANNTYLLERDYGWSGVSLDIDPSLVSRFNALRRNRSITADATDVDYRQLLSDIAVAGRVDYLSLDVEPAATTFQVLQRLPLSECRFSVVTYEHDCYVSGPEWMARSRSHFEGYGYVRVVSNVMVCGRDFEDWWVDPQVVPESVWRPFVAQEIECAKIFETSGLPKRVMPHRRHAR